MLCVLVTVSSWAICAPVSHGRDNPPLSVLPTDIGACAKNYGDAGGPTGMGALWHRLAPCISEGHGYLDHDAVQQIMGVKTGPAIPLSDGSIIVDYSSHGGCGLTFRLEVDSLSEDRKMSWKDIQRPSGIDQQSASVLDAACRGGVDSLPLNEVEKDLAAMGFRKTGETTAYPKIATYSRFEGLEQVLLFYYSPPETVPVIESIRIYGFAQKKRAATH